MSRRRKNDPTAGECCLLCGRPYDPPKPAKQKPTCHTCGQPFTRATPWRLLRGKRVHVACIDQAHRRGEETL